MSVFLSNAIKTAQPTVITANVTIPAVLLFIILSTSTRMIGARNEQNAPMVVQKPIPAANAGPLNN